MPQWSPRSPEGTHPDHPVEFHGLLLAVVEPTADRREHGLVIGVKPRLDGTAMEPAGNRREHPNVGWVANIT